MLSFTMANVWLVALTDDSVKESKSGLKRCRAGPTNLRKLRLRGCPKGSRRWPGCYGRTALFGVLRADLFLTVNTKGEWWGAVPCSGFPIGARGVIMAFHQ